MAYRDWHVGMKVTLVKADDLEWRKGNKGDRRGEILPKLGEVYTIRALMMFGDVLFVHLVEITNDPLPYMLPDGAQVMECPFEAVYFRPVQTRKTDISIFRSMLTPSRTDAENAAGMVS